jgi:ribonucleotide monophosphatase NagD (HAD superfamily)
MGKPSKEYFSAALESMNLKPEEVVMIGDDITSDIGGAQKNSNIYLFLILFDYYFEILLKKHLILNIY